MAGRRRQRPAGDLHRPLPLLVRGRQRWPATPAKSWAQRRLLQDPQRLPGHRGPHDGALHRGSSLAANSRSIAGSSSAAPIPPSSSASIRRKASSPQAATPTSWSGIPKRPIPFSAETHHQQTDYNLYEGMKVTGMPAVVLSRGPIVVDDGEWKGAEGAGQFSTAVASERAKPAPKAPPAATSAAGAKRRSRIE